MAADTGFGDVEGGSSEQGKREGELHFFQSALTLEKRSVAGFVTEWGWIGMVTVIPK